MGLTPCYVSLVLCIIAEGPGLTRSVLSQLTQLFLTVTVECPSYEVYT